MFAHLSCSYSIHYDVTASCVGTLEERGITQWQQTRDLGGRLVSDPFLRKEIRKTYDLPFGMACLRKYR